MPKAQVVPRYAKNWHGGERKFVDKLWFGYFRCTGFPTEDPATRGNERAQDTPTWRHIFEMKLRRMATGYRPPQLPIFSNPRSHSVTLCYEDLQKKKSIGTFWLCQDLIARRFLSQILCLIACQKEDKKISYLRRGRLIFEFAACSLLHSKTFILWMNK